MRLVSRLLVSSVNYHQRIFLRILGINNLMHFAVFVYYFFAKNKRRLMPPPQRLLRRRLKKRPPLIRRLLRKRRQRHKKMVSQAPEIVLVRVF